LREKDEEEEGEEESRGRIERKRRKETEENPGRISTKTHRIGYTVWVK
jgi:hypothetical protein